MVFFRVLLGPGGRALRGSWGLQHGRHALQRGLHRRLPPGDALRVPERCAARRGRRGAKLNGVDPSDGGLGAT